jgi:hypothetical protein
MQAHRPSGLLVTPYKCNPQKDINKSFFIPIGLFGAMTGMCLNVFLRRHGPLFIWALGIVLFLFWFAVFPELSIWDQVRQFIQRRITFKIRDLVDTGISMSA